MAFRDATRRSGKPLRQADLPKPLSDALLHHFGSIARARSAAGLAALGRTRQWSIERVVAELRKLHRAGVELRMFDLKALGRHDLVSAAAKYAGGLDRARRLAGVPAPERRKGLAPPWDPASIVSEIRSRHRSGETLAHGKAPRPLVRAGCYFFGTWAAAIEAAGLDYDRIRLVRPAYDKDELLDTLCGLARKHPNATLGDFSRKPLQKYKIQLKRHFGGIAKAAVAAGLHDWPKRRKHALLSATAVKAALRERQRNGETLHENPVAREDPHLVASARRRFGHWRAALEAAGLARKVPLPRAWTTESVIQSLRERHRAGLPMNPAAFRRDDYGLYQAAGRLFGDYWTAARKAGVFKPPPVWTKERVLRELRALGRGGDPVTTTRAGMHLASACSRFFGSFGAACREAGVQQRIRQQWSKERVIAALRRVHRQHGRATEGVVDGALAQACRVHFGSMPAARRAAGLE